MARGSFSGRSRGAFLWGMVAVVIMSLRGAPFAATVHRLREYRFQFLICGGSPVFAGDERIVATNEVGRGMSSPRLCGGACSRR